MNNKMNIKFLTQLFKVTIYFLGFLLVFIFLIILSEIEIAHEVDFDDITRSKIDFAMVSSVLFEG